MPKHRKHKSSKPKKSTKQPKAEQPRRPQLGASNAGFSDNSDEDRDQLGAALAAYLSDLDEDEREAVLARIQEMRAALGDDFEIIGSDADLDEDDLDDPDFSAQFMTTGSWNVPKTETPANLITQLVSAPEPPSPLDLHGFSDLSREDAELVRSQWELIAPDRRRYVIRELMEQAEENLDLQLGRLLRIAMSDPDAETRQLAIRGLWNDAETDLIGPLIQAMRHDAEVMVRAAAATGLGSFIYLGELDELDAALAMRVEEALLGIINQSGEPLEVRRRALESIAFSGEAGVRQLIEDAYYSADELMRISAIFAMGRSADIHWRSLVRAELQSPSAAVRLEAVRACGELGAKSAAADLSALLQDRDQAVRLETILALGRIGGGVAREALETVLLSDDPAEVEAAEYALEEMQFYDQVDAIALFDESLDEEDEWESDAEDDEWYEDFAARDLGEYEDTDDYDDDADDDADDDWDDDDDATSGPRRH